MPGTILRIERMVSRPGGIETPHRTGDGHFQLADPAKGKTKHHAEHAIYVRTLEEVADLVQRGFSLWMTRPGKRPSLISPGSLRVVRK